MTLSTRLWFNVIYTDISCVPLEWVEKQVLSQKRNRKKKKKKLYKIAITTLYEARSLLLKVGFESGKVHGLTSSHGIDQLGRGGG